MAALELLANSSVLPVNYSLAEITIPDNVAIESVPDEQLPEHWDSLMPGVESQHFGDQWVREQRSAVLSVPSSIIPSERNFILNPAHRNFRQIGFSVPQHFNFDPRLR